MFVLDANPCNECSPEGSPECVSSEYSTFCNNPQYQCSGIRRVGSQMLFETPASVSMPFPAIRNTNLTHETRWGGGECHTTLLEGIQ